MGEMEEMAAMARTDRTAEMELQGRTGRTETKDRWDLKVKRAIQVLKVFKA